MNQAQNQAKKWLKYLAKGFSQKGAKIKEKLAADERGYVYMGRKK